MLAACLAIAACTEPKPGYEAVAETTPPSSIEPSSSVAPSSTTPAPSGEPFVIGVVNSEGNPGVDFPDFSIAFRAAANYINSELGGFERAVGHEQVETDHRHVDTARSEVLSAGL